MKHSLDLHDRGTHHIHRWLPRCSCGTWVGVPLRDRGRAADEYRGHVRAAEREVSKATRVKVSRVGSGRHARVRHVQQPAGPRPVTPWADLPPELQ